MYSVLIVDDERRAREGLLRSIDWDAMGIVPCAAAGSAEQALLLLEQYRPDILFTDIRMRNMDGLELGQRARQLLPDIEIVFVSGYSESELIRQALRVEAVDYVYKPVRLTEVSSAMRRVVQKLDDKRSVRERELRLQQLLADGLPLLRERFLQRWFGGALLEEDEIRRKAEELGIRLPEGSLCWPVLFAIDSADVEESLVQVTLLSGLESAFPHALTCGLGQEVAAVLPTEEALPEADLDSKLSAFLSQLSDEHDGLHISAGVGTAARDLRSIPYGFSAARTALQERFFARDGNVFSYAFDASSPLAPSRTIQLPALLMELLHCADSSALRACMGDLLEKARQRHDIDQARLLCVRLALIAEEILSAHSIGGGQTIRYIQDILRAPTFENVQQRCMAFIDETCYNLDMFLGEKSISRSVREYIRSHIEEKITIHRIAQALHYSPAHLGVLYKRETGETVGDAIVNIRIGEAMRLLRDSDMLVQEVAIRVGFLDQAHLARLFKKTTGLTPGEYRKQAL